MSEQKAKLFLSFLLAIIMVSTMAGVSYTFFSSQQGTTKPPMASPTTQSTLEPSVMPSSIPPEIPPLLQPSPSSSFSPSIPLYIDFSAEPGENGLVSVNVARGKSAPLDVILTSRSSETEYIIPLYLAITAFENQILQSGYKILAIPPEPYSTQFPWPSGLIDQSNNTMPFTATFDANPLTIEPMGKLVSRITFQAAENATIGSYYVAMGLGNCNQTNPGETIFEVMVEP